jgi:DNA-binding LacI/PurR family transcriptional regulator
MAVRLKDVAKWAGVSTKTVSNVLNDYVHVTPEMRARVQAAMDELKYRPNLTARSLRTGLTRNVALAVPRLDEPYFAELAAFVIEAAERHGLTVLVEQTDGLQARERQVLSGMPPQLIDGLILSPLALNFDDLQSAEPDRPLVLLGERVHGGRFSHVAIDNVAAAGRATQHLLEIGRRRIAVIGYQSFASAVASHLRYQGYVEALRAAGLEVDPALVPAVAVFHRPEGAAAMDQLLDLDEPPDGVFCFNDLLALGAIRSLHNHGVRIPSQVAVVGFDDIEEGRYSLPTLTTIAPDKRQIADFAIRSLLSQIKGENPRPEELPVAFSLMVRESTAGVV